MRDLAEQEIGQMVFDGGLDVVGISCCCRDLRLPFEHQRHLKVYVCEEFPQEKLPLSLLESWMVDIDQHRSYSYHWIVAVVMSHWHAYVEGSNSGAEFDLSCIGATENPSGQEPAI